MLLFQLTFAVVLEFPDIWQSRSQSTCMPVRGLHNPRTGILWERDWIYGVKSPLSLYKHC